MWALVVGQVMPAATRVAGSCKFARTTPPNRSWLPIVARPLGVCVLGPSGADMLGLERFLQLASAPEEDQCDRMTLPPRS
jgi:hypothetical protein